MSHLFRSLTPTPHAKTGDELAVEMMVDACERYAVLRAEAKQREANAEPPAEWSAEANECMLTMDSLMKGRHRRAVQAVLVKYFPELLTPATATDAAIAQAMTAPDGKAN